MASYLLLRNNKESGPYEWSDLVRLGLKPYDLVWLQGKSAAWRYPSEIEELKPYAPIVEEQPYDRFFKKKTTEKKEECPAPEKPATQEQPAIEKKYEKYIPKKPVFVALPGQNSMPALQPPAGSPVIIVRENPAAAQVGQCNPLDEIKEKYAKTLQQRKDKIARKSFRVASLKRAAVIAGLVLSGVLAGFIIRSNSGQPPLAQQTAQASTIMASAPEPLAAPPLLQEHPAMLSQALSSDILKSGALHTERNLPAKVKERLWQQEKQQLVQDRVEKDPVVMPPPVEKEMPDETPVIKISEPDRLTGERNRRIRTGNEEEKKPAIATNRAAGITSLVSVTSNDYIRVAFGGIRNLQLTVINNSKHKLDKVIVELQYVKPNEEPLKTEHIRFDDIAPNSTATRKVKDTNRGIKVLYKIIEIQPLQPETALSGF